MKSPSEPHLKWTALFAMLLGVVILRLWISPLPSSLWLDETGTYWLIRDGLYHAIRHGRNFPTSPAYLVVAWAMLKAGGAREFVLRLPSIGAMLAATFLLYRLGTRLFNRGTGLMAALVFSGLPTIVFAASDARPYALAVLAMIASTLMLARWLESGRARDAFGYALVAAQIPWLHPLFATIFVVHTLYALQHLRACRRVSLGSIFSVGLLLGLLVVPLLLYFSPAFSDAHTHSFAPVPSVEDLFKIFVPKLAVAGILLGLVIGTLGTPRLEFDPAPMRQATFVLLASWVIVPPLSLFVISRMTGIGLFVERYCIPMMPGLALFLGWGLQSLNPISRRITVATALTVAVLSPTLRERSFWTTHDNEGWREAVRAVGSITSKNATTVLFRAGFVEGDAIDRYTDREFRQMLLAPLSMYPLTANYVIPIPYTFSRKAEEYLEEEMSNSLKPGDQLVYISRGRNSPFEPWLEAKLQIDDLVPRNVGDFGDVQVLLFERNR